MSRVIFRFHGRFASPSNPHAVPYSGPRKLGGAVAKAVRKKRKLKRRRVQRRREVRVRRKVERPLILRPRVFPKEYISSFRYFLKPVSSVGRRKWARFYALVEVTEMPSGSPPENPTLPGPWIVPVNLGMMTGAQARRLTKEDLDHAISFKPWASKVTGIVGVWAARTKGERKRLAKKHLRKKK